MTTEQKAKAYDEALNRAKEMCGALPTDEATMEYIFPELCESEDERIRKCIGMALTDVKEQRFKDYDTSLKDCLSWLEKQKENIEKEYVFRPLVGTDINTAALQAIRRANEGDRLVLAFNGAYIPVRKGCNANKIVDIYDTFIEKQKEQKPVVTHGETYHVDTLGTQQVIAGKMPQKPAEWSEKDKAYLNIIVEDLKELYKKRKATPDSILGKSQMDNISWFKSLPERFNLQPKNEWSEENDLTIADLINYFEGDSLGCSAEEMVQRIKSLRPSWKPSEEQMNGLAHAINLDVYDAKRYGLDSLYSDLKKLM